MARVFAAGSSEKLQVSSAPVTAVPLTIAAWARCTDSGTNIFRRVCSIGQIGTTNNVFELYFQEFFGKQAAFNSESSAGSAAVATSTNWTVGQWHHLCGVSSAINSRAVYLDGGGKGTNATSRTPAGLDTLCIGVRAESAPAASEYMTGDIANVTVWNVALTDAEVASLATGISPWMIRPESIVFHTDIWGNDSPEVDIKGGISLTVTGTSKSSHPRLFGIPRRRNMTKITAAASPFKLPELSMNSVLSRY